MDMCQLTTERNTLQETKGLDLNLSSSKSEVGSDSNQGNNEIRIQPGEDLDHGHEEVELSSDDYTSSDNDLDY